MEGLTDVAIARIGIAIAVVVLLIVIFVTGQKKMAQGKRVSARIEPGAEPDSDDHPAHTRERREPSLGELLYQQNDLSSTHADDQVSHQSKPEPAPEQVELSLDTGNQKGAREDTAFERIVTLYIAARAGESLHGDDLVVAAEKAGLVYGHMNIFHRLTENQNEDPPIFSVANLLKPGSFDMSKIRELRTPGISFFMTLPGPLPALDAWDVMLPCAQRMAELLDAVLLDEERNALGRQRIAHIREELRGFDRRHEAQNIRW